MLARLFYMQVIYDSYKEAAANISLTFFRFQI